MFINHKFNVSQSKRNAVVCYVVLCWVLIPLCLKYNNVKDTEAVAKVVAT